MLIILLAIFTVTQLVPIGLCTSISQGSLDEAQGSHHGCSPNHTTCKLQSYTTQRRAQLYWKDTALKLQKNLFRSMEKKYAGFFSKLPKKFEAASTQPPLLSTQALTESLFLALLHRQNSLLSAIYFHFYLKGREELGFYVQQTQTELFLQCIRLWSTSTNMNAYLNFHRNNNFALLI